MMRASVFRRSPLLLLAAALLALAAFLVQDSRPASADHEDLTVVWQATLTVLGEFAAVQGVGCDAFGVTQACSARLTEDEFTYAGTTYSVGALYNTPTGVTSLKFDPALPADLRSTATVYIDDRALSLADFTPSAADPAALQFSPSPRVPAWTADQEVQFLLTAPRPPATLWSATLTLQDLGAGAIWGCDNTVTSKECTATSVLTDDDFTYNGVNYEFIYMNTVSDVPEFNLWFNKTVPADLKSAGTIHIDGVAYPFADARLSDNASASIPNSILGFRPSPRSWSAGDTVSLSVTVPAEPPPTGVQISIWNSTLTVKDNTATPTWGDLGLGCDLLATGQGGGCAANLTVSTFSHGGTNYVVGGVALVSGGNLKLYLEGDIPAGILSDGTLHVDGAAFSFADATSRDGLTATWPNSGLSWSEDDTVELRLSVPTLPVTEGGTATFAVALTDDPGASTDVQLVKGGYQQGSVGESGYEWDLTAAELSPETLTFTSSDYGTPQTVTVTAPEDPDNRDEQLVVVVLQDGRAVGGGSNTVDGIRITVTDNDTNAAVPTNLQALTGRYVSASSLAWLLRFSWDAPSGQTVSRYDLHWKRGAAPYWSPLPVPTAISGTSAMFRGFLAEGTGIQWRVRAHTSIGVTDWVTGPTFTVSNPANLVRNLDKTEGDGQLALTWNPPADWPVADDGYDVWYKESGAPDGVHVYDGTTGGTSYSTPHPSTGWMDAGHTGAGTSHTIRNLDNGTNYQVQVRLQSGWGFAWQTVWGTPSSSSAPATGSPTAVTLALDPATVSEGGSVTLTATLDAPAPDGGISLRLNPGPDDTATRGTDYTMPAGIDIAAGELSGAATITVIDDAVSEGDETATITAFAALLDGDLTGSATLTITDDAIAGVTEQQQSPQASKYADLIADMRGWRDDPCCAGDKAHTDRWDRALLAFGETVADASLTPMTAAEAQTHADWGWTRWVNVAAALREIESTAPAVSQQTPYADLINKIKSWRDDPCCAGDKAHTDRWDRTLLALGEPVADTTLTTMTADEAQTHADKGWTRWVEVVAALKEIESAGLRVSSAIADMSMETDESRDISLSGVFSGDGALTFTAASSDEDVASAFEFHGTLTIAALSEGSATITVTAEDSDGNTVSDEFDVSVTAPPTAVSDLRCIAETGRVAFLWDAPEWSGGEVYAYDYQMTLPDGRSEGGRLRDITLLLRPGAYQAGGEADVSVTVVYETPGGSQVSSAAATLTCTVAQ